MLTRRFLATLLTTTLVMLSLPAWAGGRIIYRLALKPPQEVVSAPTKEGKQAFSDIAVERLRKRFKAAAVKEYEFRTTKSDTLVLETGWDHDRAWMEALMTSPGKVEVRRVTPGVTDWLGLARQLPKGIELRGDQPPHVWSASRTDLTAFLSRISVAGGMLTVFPAERGFRSVSLGEVIATERQIKSARARQSSRGAPFVLVDFETAVGASLAAAHVSEVEQVAIVLDGELVSFVPAKSFLEHSPVRLSVPDGAVPDDREQRSLWVRQVAGRLAAPLPISIAVLKE